MEQYEYQDAFGSIRSVSEEDLKTLASQGAIHPDTLLRKAGGMTWAQARVVQGLTFAPHKAHLGPGYAQRPVASPASADAKRWSSLAWYAAALCIVFSVAGLVLLLLGVANVGQLGLDAFGTTVSLPDWASASTLCAVGEQAATACGVLSTVKVCGMAGCALFIAVSSRAIQLHATAKAKTLR
jgi:hypothetical protein